LKMKIKLRNYLIRRIAGHCMRQRHCVDFSMACGTDNYALAVLGCLSSLLSFCTNVVGATSCEGFRCFSQYSHLPD